MAVEISQGICDLCGAPSDASLQECNWLTCTYQHCEGGLYHQECLEKYLKSNKLEKNRKTGFKCPRGCGKGTRFDQACPGRIDKSHPIHPRNEDKKKTKLAAVVVEPQRPAKPAAPATQNGKPGKTKEDAKPEAGKESKTTAPTKPAPVAKPAAVASAAASPLLALGSKAVRKDATALPPRPEAVAKQKLAEQVALARRELGLSAANASLSTHGSKGDLQGLASSAAGPSKPASLATPSVWGKPPSPATEPLVLSPQPTMMSQLPQFQQLLQQAAAGKKQAGGKTASGPTSSQAAAKQAPAVPQPVTPPTPVWPALGAAASSSSSSQLQQQQQQQQTSAAALFSASAASGSGSTSSWQTPREAVSNRPGSPPSAWGGASTSSAGSGAAPSSSSQQQQYSQAPQQLASQQAAGPASSLPPAVGAGLRGAAASAAAASATGTPTAGAGSAAASTSGTGSVILSTGSLASGMGASTAAGSATAASSAAGTSTGQGGSAGAMAGAVGSSGRISASSEAQPSAASGSSAAAAAAGSGAAASTSSASRGAEMPLVGADFVDEEAKEPKLTKAQKKNLKRIEKKKSPLSASGEQQQGGAGERTAGGADLPDEPSRASHDGAGVATAAAAAAAGHIGSGGSVGGGMHHADVEASGAVSGSGRGLGSGAHHRREPSRGSEDPEQAHHVAEAEEAAVMEELCINCIVARKVLSLITQLQRLGALEFVAAAAVQRFGSNLLAALEWLLVAGADAAAAPPESVLAAAAESASAAESEIDISEELQQLHDLQAAMGVPNELLQQCVLDCNGDVQTAANTAMERMLAVPSGSASAAGAASVAATAGTSRAGGRVSSGSGSGMVAGQGNGVALRGSPSFYSVSSLDGGASVHDSEAAAVQQQKQQPSRSSHFGVRLQDEPAGCSNGGAGGGGYGVADAITSGFLRGGVVLGASAWANGYVSRETRAEGSAVSMRTATAGFAGSRNTSRLLHWLRDEPGRAAALEEEQPASGGGGFSADPVLDSPFSAQGSGSVTSHRGLGCSVAGELNAPTLTTWLGSNGYHHSGAGMAGQAQGTGGGPHGLYGSVEHSTGNFSFASALSKPPSTGSQLDSLCGYGSRWTSLGASDGQRQEGPTGLLFGPPGTATVGESEPAAHGDGDNDLSSIMALINVR